MKKRSEIPRHEDDFYRTPAYCTEALLAVESFPHWLWEPSCGDGAISRVLERHGHRVASSDLVERGFGTAGIDFLDVAVRPKPRDFDFAIVMNPPFSLAPAFALHALKFQPQKMALLLRLSWLEGRRRFNFLFKGKPPSRIWVFCDRVTMWHGDDPKAKTTGGATPYAWFVWDKSATNYAPEVHWIERAKHPDRLEDTLGGLEAAIKVLRLELGHAIRSA